MFLLDVFDLLSKKHTCLNLIYRGTWCFFSPFTSLMFHGWQKASPEKWDVEQLILTRLKTGILRPFRGVGQR